MIHVPRDSSIHVSIYTMVLSMSNIRIYKYIYRNVFRPPSPAQGRHQSCLQTQVDTGLRCPNMAASVPPLCDFQSVEVLPVVEVLEAILLE